jgi:hypothetical protein
MTGHLDLDELADVVSGAEAPAHLAGCPSCQSAVQELREASAATTAALAALGPLAMPDDVAARLHASFTGSLDDRDAEDGDDPDDAPAIASLTTLPARAPVGPARWLGAAAAALIVLAGAGYGISRLADRGDSAGTGGTAAGAAAPTANLVRNSSGTDYADRAALLAAVPRLLTGAERSADSFSTRKSGSPPKVAAPNTAAQPGAVGGADPLARLRTDAGLADCLVALLPPDDASVKPLAIDYGAFHGTPAMIVLLPSSLPKKVDVFVVGAGCSQANDSTLFYTSADRP